MEVEGRKVEQQQNENTQTDLKSVRQPLQKKFFALFRCEKYETTFLTFTIIRGVARRNFKYI
jgi:hypothetical protein